MNPQLPRITERLDLLRLPSRVLGLGVLDVAFASQTCQLEPNLMP